MSKRAVVVIVAVLGTLALGGAILWWSAPRSVLLSDLMEASVPGAIPATAYARNLKSSDVDLVRESLAHLKERGDPIAVPQAIALLGSHDDYVWLNAAHYLGACKRQEAVPYLIKALRHTAWRSDDERTRYLRQMTGQEIGSDFEQWRSWWTQQHPGQTFDWVSFLGHAPRLTANEK